MVPCKSTAEEVSFELSHCRISSTDSKVRTTLHVSIIDAGNERVNINYYVNFSEIHRDYSVKNLCHTAEYFYSAGKDKN